MAQGGPASDPSSVRPQLESTFAQPAGPVKLLLYFGSERSGEVMAKFMKAYGWGWQRISQKSPLKRVLHNAKRALEDHGHDQIIVCADGSHSEGAWARAAQQCNRTVHMLALHVADSLQIVAGPGEPHAPRLCIESISEDQGADLQLQNPKKGRYSAVMTADTPSQLQAALAYLCQHSQKQPTQPATQADGLIDYRQRPYAAVHFMNIVPAALDEGAGDEVSVDAFDREDHVEARDQDSSHHRPAGKDGMHGGGDQQQPHVPHGGSRQARAGAGAHSHQEHHVQSNGWEGPHAAAHRPFHQQHHRHIQQPQQQQQPQQHQPLGFGRGMQQSHATQPFQTGPHAPRHNGRGPQMAGQWHMHPGGGMPQGWPGMGWGSPAPHNPDDWRQGPIPFHSFAPDDLLGPPWPGTASLLQNPAHPPHQIHHADMPASMPGQYNTHGQPYSRQHGRMSSTDGGLRPTPITLQAPHDVRYPGRSEGREGNLQNAMAYAPGQPWASGSFLPENEPHAAYTHQQPYGMQMQPPGQQERTSGLEGSAGKGKKHWKKKPETDAHDQDGDGAVEDQGQGQGKKHGKKHKLGQSVEGDRAESKEQSQVQKKQKLTRKQKRRERDREETADGDMLRWLETGLLPAWWSSVRGSPSHNHQMAADKQPTTEGGMLHGLESAGDGLDAAAASEDHAPRHGERGSNGNEAAQQDLPENGQGPHAMPAAGDVPNRDDCPPDEPIDLRPLLLFDLNGTLTAHTSVRKGSGRNEMRPGLHHLRRLQEHFRLGIFTSSSMRTVQAVIPLLEAAAGPGPRLFSRPELVLFRDHTLPAPAAHVEAGGNFWDTCKPLTKWFSRLHRTLLFDDDAYKAYSGEKSNMVLVPCWAEADAEDSCIAVIVDAVLEVLGPLGQNDDLRGHTPELTARITRGVQAIAQKEVQQMQEGELLPAC